MGVETNADKKISEAKEHIAKAYKCLLEVMDEDCWGRSELKTDYVEEEIPNIAIELLKLKKKL